MFFGFHIVKAYDYWWGYSSAQIELMIADSPVIIYKKSSEGNKHSKSELEDLTRRWKEKKQREAMEGKVVNLNDFLKNKNG